MTGRSRLGWLTVTAGVLALAVAGALWWSARSGGPAAHAEPVVDRGTVPMTPPPSSTAPRTGVPVPAGSTLRIPALHVTAPIGQVRAPGGVMQVPRDPARVAWWRDGARPGSSTGSAVIVGHINFHGVSGALADLPRLDPGDSVALAEPGRTLRYRVAAVRTYPKSSGIPGTAFDRDGPARLVLITCGGPFDSSTGNYQDNIVVYAVPA